MPAMDVLQSFGIGALASVVATIITNLFIASRERRRYTDAIGTYVGYAFDDDNANPLVQSQSPQSTAKVAHVKRNILHIEVNHADRTWDGQIAMEQETFGSLVWKYTDYPMPKHAFGLKRFLVRPEEERVLLYLLGEPPFGKEVFIRER